MNPSSLFGRCGLWTTLCVEWIQRRLRSSRDRVSTSAAPRWGTGTSNSKEDREKSGLLLARHYRLRHAPPLRLADCCSSDPVGTGRAPPRRWYRLDAGKIEGCGCCAAYRGRGATRSPCPGLQ